LYTIDDPAGGWSWSFSPDARHFGYVAATHEPKPAPNGGSETASGHGVSQDEKEAVVLDGVRGPWYDEIHPRTLGSPHLPDGSSGAGFPRFPDRLGRDSYLSPPVKFTPDGGRWAYVARQGDKWLAVVDGIEGNEYDEITNGHLIFSPDGGSHAYMARRDDKHFVVVNGVEGTAYGSIDPWSLTAGFSGRFAYKAQEAGEEFVVVDGLEGKRFNFVYNIAFSGDGRHYAYTAIKRGGFCLVVNGEVRQYPPTRVLGQLALDHDGSRVACCVMNTASGRSYVEVNGRPGSSFKTVRDPMFTSAGKLLYTAEKRGREYLVFDGRKFGPYDDARMRTVSPDGRHIAFKASLSPNFMTSLARKLDRLTGMTPVLMQSAARHVVSDLSPRRRVEKCRGLFFSADGQHLAWLARSDHAWRVFVDGRPKRTMSWPALPAYYMSNSGPGYWRALVVSQDRYVHLMEVRFKDAPNPAKKP
jgi:hypothetical protein